MNSNNIAQQYCNDHLTKRRAILQKLCPLDPAPGLTRPATISTVSGPCRLSATRGRAMDNHIEWLRTDAGRPADTAEKLIAAYRDGRRVQRYSTDFSPGHVDWVDCTFREALHAIAISDLLRIEQHVDWTYALVWKNGSVSAHDDLAHVRLMVESDPTISFVYRYTGKAEMSLLYRLGEWVNE